MPKLIMRGKTSITMTLMLSGTVGMRAPIASKASMASFASMSSLSCCLHELNIVALTVAHLRCTKHATCVNAGLFIYSCFVYVVWYSKS